MQNVRIVEIPNCKMVSSGTGMFGEETFHGFNRWFSGLPKSIYPKDFLYHNGDGFCWLYLYEPGLEVPAEFEIVDFQGGLYAVTTDIDQQTDVDAMAAERSAFLQENGLIEDSSRFPLGNIITSHRASEALGYEQMDYYTPIKAQ